MFYWIWGICIFFNSIMLFLDAKYDTKHEYNKQITVSDCLLFIIFGIILAPLATIIIPAAFIQQRKDFVVFRWGQNKEKKNEEIPD